MKRLILLSPLFLAACLGPQGGSSSAGPSDKIGDAVLPIEVVQPSPDPTPAPEVQDPFSLTSIDGKSLTQSNGSISLSGSSIVDGRCGWTANITEALEANETLTIKTSVVLPSQAVDACKVITQSPHATFILAGVCRPAPNYLAPLLVPVKVIYTVSRASSGAIMITRALESQGYRRSCASTLLTPETGVMAEEAYFE